MGLPWSWREWHRKNINSRDETHSDVQEKQFLQQQQYWVGFPKARLCTGKININYIFFILKNN